MNSYLIAYSTNKDEDKIRPVIYSFLKNPKTNLKNKIWNSLPGVWILNSPLSATQIRTKLLESFEETEHLLIIEIGKSAAWNTDTPENSDLILNILSLKS